MLHRTPPRRSPRLNNDQVIDQSSMENANAIFPPASEPIAATAQPNEGALSADSTAAATQGNSISTAAASVPLTSSNYVPATFTKPAAQTASTANLLVSLQKRLLAIETELRNTQVELDEKNVQCQSLKEALQNKTAPPVISSSYSLTPQPLPSTVTHGPLPPVPLSYPLFSAHCSQSGGTVNTSHVTFATIPNNFNAQQSPPVWCSASQPIMSTTPIYSACYNGASQQQFTAPRKLQDLPQFSGEPEDWPMFSSTYAESTAVYNYTNLENSMRLQKSLKGQARDAVKCMMIHADNVNMVME